MSTDNDDSVPLALFLAAGTAAAVIAGVIALAVFSKPKTVVAPAISPAAVVNAMLSAAVDATLTPPFAATATETETATLLEILYFAVGSADLPADASAKLARLADAARASTVTSVQISGYHDASGGAAKNAELAKQRALAVRHALEANGVSPDRLQMSKPVETTGGTDPKDSHRVEMRLQ